MSTLDTLDHKEYGFEKQEVEEGGDGKTYTVKAKTISKVLQSLTDALSKAGVTPSQVINGAKSYQTILFKLPSGELIQIGKSWKYPSTYLIFPISSSEFDTTATWIKQANDKADTKARAKVILASNGFSQEDIKRILP